MARRMSRFSFRGGGARRSGSIAVYLTRGVYAWAAA